MKSVPKLCKHLQAEIDADMKEMANYGLSRHKPLIGKRNITVGVYYSKEFRDAVHVEKLGPINQNIPVGKASIKMLDEVFATAFDRVLKIKEWPVAATNLSEADVVIEPTLEAFWVIHLESHLGIVRMRTPRLRRCFPYTLDIKSSSIQQMERS